MAIDVADAGSPGWWMWRLAEEQRKRRARLDELWERYSGRPPLPEGMEAAGPIFQRFAKKARLNVAQLAVQAVLDRLTLVGFRVGADQIRQESFDALATRIWVGNQMPIEAHDLHEFVAVMGVGYAIVGPVPDDEDLPVITAEDPREVITAHDPARRSRTLAALKFMWDPMEEVDRAYLYLPGEGRDDPGEVWKARRAGKSGGSSTFGRRFRFSPRGWDWEADEPDTLPTREVPVIRYENHGAMGEFESHVDVCDRINHMILQRMVIATLQAFRQRAIKGLPKTDPKTGEDIDYDKIFSADPGALWQLPAAAEMWESGQVDLTPILSAVKDDVRDFAALTSTPLTYFTPDAANGSAEGASLLREGLVFRTEDRQMRNGVGHARTMALAMRYAEEAGPEVDDTEAEAPRSDSEVTPVWGPAERFSLAQRYDAAVKGVTAGVPWETRMLDVLQFTPAQVERMRMERMNDSLVAPSAPTAPDQNADPANQFADVG